MDIRQLFIKHAQGSCTAEEKALLIAYLQEGGDPAHLPDPDELDATIRELPLMGTTAAERVLENILDVCHTSKVRHTLAIRQLIIKWTAAAAIAALIITTAFLWQARSRTAWATLYAGYGQIRSITLPDGSIITLNANSTLKYDTLQHNGVREVWLQGEAFFNITPDAAGQFTVHAGQALKIAVLGTQFNVRSNDSTVQVVLNSGRVKVSAGSGERAENMLLLQPGEMAVYRNAGQLLSKQAADTVVLTSWKDNRFTFHQTRLADIVVLIQQQFGVKVVLAQPQLGALLFTGTVPANNMELLLSILERSLDIRVDKSGRQIVIRPAH